MGKINKFYLILVSTIISISIASASTNWYMTTQDGTNTININISTGSVVSTDIKFLNNETKNVNVSLNCTGDLCSYIKVDYPSINIPSKLNLPSIITITINIPSTIEQKSLQAYLIGKDNDGLENYIILSVNVVNKDIIKDMIEKISSSKNISGLEIPYIFISLLVFFISVICLNFFFKNLELRAIIIFILGVMITLFVIWFI